MQDTRSPGGPEPITPEGWIVVDLADYQFLVGHDPPRPGSFLRQVREDFRSRIAFRCWTSGGWLVVLGLAIFLIGGEEGWMWLALRLAGHALGVSGGALAAVPSQNVASAGVPTSVVSSTIKAATLFAAGQAASGVISVKVAALTEGVLKAMLVTKLKIAPVVVLMIAALVGWAGLFYPTQAAEAKADKDKQPAAKPAEKPKTDNKKEGQDKPLKKAEQAIVADFKKLNAKEATITIATYTNGAPGNTENELAEAGDLELTRSLAKGVKVFIVEVKDSKDRDLKDKVRKEIKLEDLAKLKPKKMWVYHNEEPDGSMGRIVMEIIVFVTPEKEAAKQEKK
jgi:hypothetical protein